MPLFNSPADPSLERRRSILRADGLLPTLESARSIIAGSEARLDCVELDPAIALERSRRGRDFDPLALIESRACRRVPSGARPESLFKLWRYSVATGLAARRIAKASEEPDPDATFRAGLLHRLGLWLLAMSEPGLFENWIEETDPRARRSLLWAAFGMSLEEISRRWAVRLGCEPGVVDATWLRGGGFDAAADPKRLAYVEAGRAVADRTPWALEAPRGIQASSRELESEVKIITAQVQSKCGGAFFATSEGDEREERLLRELAKERRANRSLIRERDDWVRFGSAFVERPSGETLEEWADRVDGRLGKGSLEALSTEIGSTPRDSRGEPRAQHAWEAWATRVGEVESLRRALGKSVEALSEISTGSNDDPSRPLEALAQFAAGAGHELNNPLAVILGRAQLLLAKESDPEQARALRAVIAQAQRAHRVLRDLMYVARPPDPRPKPCCPEEILRASARDLAGEAEARGVRIEFDTRADRPLSRIVNDPDLLRHVADVLIRNALEATPSGGVVTIDSVREQGELRWSVRDTGRGLSETDARHLFDPFYCGRQAGRGLGLGLPRVARAVERIGGRIFFDSVEGRGSVFHMTCPAKSRDAA